MRNQILKVLLIGFFVLSLPALVFSQEKQIKIGFIAPLSGPMAQIGKDMVDGTTLYLNPIGNQMAGRKIDLIIEDDENVAATGLTKVRKLVEMNQVSMVSGGALAAIGYAIQPYVDSKKVPTLVPVIAADDFTQRKRAKWMVRTGWNASQVMHPFGEYAYKVLGFRKVAAIGMDYAFGWELLGGFQRTFEESGGKVIQKIWCPTTTQDFSAYITQINREADAVLSMLAGRLCITFVKQYQEYGLKGKIPLIGAGTLTDESVLPSMGDEALGIITALHYSAAIDTPANKEFVKNYREKAGKLPSYYSEACYTGMRWIDQTLISLKGDVSKLDRILKAMQSVKIKETPRGPIDVDAYGNIVQNVYIRKVERVGGELQNMVIQTYPHVSQFWKYKPEEFLKLPGYSRDYPPIKP